MWAAALGKDDVLGALEGVELDAKDEQGFSALHIAVSTGLPASVAALVEMGADLKAEIVKPGKYIEIPFSIQKEANREFSTFNCKSAYWNFHIRIGRRTREATRKAFQ